MKQEQVTAENLTDKQIHEVRAQASRDRDVALHLFACDALGLTSCRLEDRDAVIKLGRERVAVAINARRGGGGK